MKLILLCFALFLVQTADAQTYLVLDRYGKKQTRLFVGDLIYFSLKGQPDLRYADHIAALNPARQEVSLERLQTTLSLSAIERFYFRRDHWRRLRQRTYFTGGGFGLSALVLEPSASFSPEEAAIWGASILAFGQVTRVWNWRKFRVQPPRSRARVLDMRF
ncbi:MAG: hypothetical protein ACFCUI_04520 [Bernardetiaceae bacterium]